MLPFRPIALTDAARFHAAYQKDGYPISDQSFGICFMWKDAQQMQWCEIDGCVFLRFLYNGAFYYTPPLGAREFAAALRLIRADACARGEPLRLSPLTEENYRQAEAVLGSPAVAMPAYFDYVYLVSDLATLAGKKYHAKRNHIAYFERTYAYTYEPLGPENLADCRAMLEAWYEMNDGEKSKALTDERRAIHTALEYYAPLGFVGGLLRVDGKVIAFTFGERLDEENFVVHVEKAFYDYRGAYPMINREFVRRALLSYRYINREEDTGDENLRRAKESYHPALLRRKYTLICEGPS